MSDVTSPEPLRPGLRERRRPWPVGRPGPHPPPDRPRRHRTDPPAQPRLMSPLVWDLAHIGQQEDLWLLRRGRRRWRRDVLPAAKVEKLYDAFEHPRAARVDPAAAHPASRPAELPAPTCAGGCSTRSTAVPEGRCRRAVPVLDGRAARAACTSRRCWPRISCATARPSSVPARRLPAGRPVPHDDVLVPAGPVRPGRRRVGTSRSRWTTSGPRTWSTCPAFRIGRVPVTNAEWPPLRRRRRVTTSGAGGPRPRLGSPHRVEAGLERPQFWTPAGRLPTSGSAVVEDLPARRAGAARFLLPRGRGLRRLGRRPAAHRAGVGEGLRRGTRSAASASGAGRGDRHRRGRPSPGQPRAAESLRPAAGRGLPGRRVGLRRRAADGRRLGVDVVGFRALARIRPRCCTPQYSAPWFGGDFKPAPRRLVGRRQPTSVRTVVPQLGPARSAGRSSAVSGSPRTSPGCAGPRHV